MIPYKEYVNHMIRCFFARGTIPQSALDAIALTDNDMSEAEKTNFVTTASVISQLPDSNVQILHDVYGQSEQSALADAVRSCARSHGANERAVWGLIRATTREIARKRGLI